MITIGLDGNGGEYIAEECLPAVRRFLANQSDCSVLLSTSKTHFDSIFSQLTPDLQPRLKWSCGPEQIAFGESPVSALRSKKKASIRVAIENLHEGLCDAVISFGHSGAATAAAKLYLGMVPPIKRPGLAAIIPNRKGWGVLMDVGANPTSQPEHLHQYAVMAKMYAQEDLGISTPRIGLLNIGAERSKGDLRLKKSFELLSLAPINFVGNVEGNQIFDGSVDVIICDGLTGNTILKSAEGLASMLFSNLHSTLSKDKDHSTAEQHIFTSLSHMAKTYHPDSRGASLLLGVSKAVYIGHGNAKAEAITNALFTAHQKLTSGLQRVLVQKLIAYY